MIRIASALFSFAALLCAWIIYQPFFDPGPGIAQVTRGEADLLLDTKTLPGSEPSEPGPSAASLVLAATVSAQSRELPFPTDDTSI